MSVLDRSATTARHVANRQFDHLLLLTSVQSAAWLAHRRARAVLPRAIRRAAWSGGLAMVAAGTGAAVGRRHPAHAHNGAPSKTDAPTAGSSGPG
jgi:hypothetical protein